MSASSKKPIVIVTRKLPDVVEERMSELFDARFNSDDTPMTHAQLVAAAKEADVLVPTVTDRIDRGVLSQAGPQLRLIANFGHPRGVLGRVAGAIMASRSSNVERNRWIAELLSPALASVS